jgi:type II secretory pathway component GspD/PulD (secretin)
MFYETSIRQALTDIATQTGVIIVPDMSVQGIVTCELKDVPLEKALEIVAVTGGYITRKMDGYYLVGSPDPKSPNFQTLSPISTETRVVKLNYLKAEDAKNLLPEPFSNYITANTERNEVCISAPRSIAYRILKDLQSADRPPRQVMLEAKIVELTADAKEQLGVDWEYEWQKPTPGENVRSGMAAFDTANTALELGYATTAEFTKRLFLTLALLCENNSATIIANPRVTAMDGQKADIKVTTEEYFKITTGPTSYAYATLQTIESGITLEMTPRIGSHGEITLKVSPEVSDVIGVGAEGLPKITRRKATTTVRVKNGGTVVIGGMATSTMQDRTTKVPLLGDIPTLGHLFKSTEAKESTRDVLIFITPRILVENGGSEPITTAVKSGQKHETVKLASQDFKKQLQEVLSRN